MQGLTSLPAAVSASRQNRASFLVKAVLMAVFAVVDLLLSTQTDYADIPKPFPIILAGVQLLLLVINALLLFMMVSGTYLFQVGLVGKLLAEFRRTILVFVLYFLLLASYVGVKMFLLIDDKLGRHQERYWEDNPFYALAAMQKAGLALYLVAVLHVISTLADLRWYMRDPWVQQYREVAK